MAGLELPQDSALKTIAETDQYKEYRVLIGAVWHRYHEENLKHISSWQKANVPAGIPDRLFYPFSGPDILNTLAFFPDTADITMMALEAPGEIPDPLTMDRNMMIADLYGLKKALQTILIINFFRSDEMLVDLKQKSFSSISGIMMFFIARSGYDILGFRKVCIDDEGNVMPRADEKPEVPRGVEFLFIKPGSLELKTARFFSLDLSDYNLHRSPRIMKYLNKPGEFSTIMKATVFLPHLDSFGVIRSRILAGSTLILQDDCGIPIRFFSPDSWQMKYFGKYRIHPLHPQRYQPELDEVMKTKSSGALPFIYGYGFSREYSHIILARKIGRRN